mmetsp:Transcript_74838/g.208087  ORF Transcript_74838/g.208087 Transcript_74838/m.208087 type:complete len:225 (+) Transcript_74838:925-1599(+)
MRLHNFLRGVHEDATLRGFKHRNVVEGVPDRDDPEVQSLERLHRLPFLVAQTKYVARDLATFLHCQRIAEHRGTADFFEHRHRILFEGIREQEHARNDGLQPFEEFLAAWQGLHAPDDVLHVLKLNAVASQDIDPVHHQLVVIRLVRCGEFQLLDACLFLQLQPRLPHQSAFYVQSHEPHARFALQGLTALRRRSVCVVKIRATVVKGPLNGVVDALRGGRQHL